MMGLTILNILIVVVGLVLTILNNYVFKYEVWEITKSLGSTFSKHR